jgi:hypothetical protein
VGGREEGLVNLRALSSSPYPDEAGGVVAKLFAGALRRNTQCLATHRALRPRFRAMQARAKPAALTPTPPPKSATTAADEDLVRIAQDAVEVVDMLLLGCVESLSDEEDAAEEVVVEMEEEEEEETRQAAR